MYIAEEAFNKGDIKNKTISKLKIDSRIMLLEDVNKEDKHIQKQYFLVYILLKKKTTSLYIYRIQKRKINLIGEI